MESYVLFGGAPSDLISGVFDEEALCSQIRDALHGGLLCWRERGTECLWLAAQYRKADVSARARLSCAVRHCFARMDDPSSAWEEDACEQLLSLMEDMLEKPEEDPELAELKQDILAAVRNGRFLEASPRRLYFHKSFLLMLTLFQPAQPELFWNERYEKLGPESGALVVRSLMKVDPAVGARRLPEILGGADVRGRAGIHLALAFGIAHNPNRAAVESALKARMEAYPQGLRRVLEEEVFPLAQGLAALSPESF